MAAVGEVIAVIDDDEFMLEAMDRLLCALGFKTELYGSAEAFVARDRLTSRVPSE